MKRGFRILVFLLLALALTAGTVLAEEPITLKLDGTVIQTEVPPIIMSGRTMAPAKFLFEAMGGTVEWLADTSQVRVNLNNTSVLLTIDSKTAQVNGQSKTMDVAPIIKNQRTLIPTSFVAQELGCTVTWINDTRTVEIVSPRQVQPSQSQGPETPAEGAGITSIVPERKSDGTYQITITADRAVEGCQGTFYTSPDRYAVDISGARLNIDVQGGEGSMATGNDLFSQVRFSQFTDSTVRVVADLLAKADGSVTVSPDKTVITIVLSEKNVIGSGDGTAADVSGMGIPALDPSLSDKLVVIDPGHGGTDSGSLGKDSSGAVIQMEKDLNLDIALRLNALLKGAGVNTHILRTDDTAIALYDRPAAANDLGAALYVSVHNNSNESPSPSGTETHYYNKPSEAGYGYTSKQVADAVQEELVKTLGLKNRGTKSSPALAVLNKSQMPAIIIEGGFISNPTELSYMMTDQFKEAYALGAARGIVKALNASLGY